MEKNPWIEIWSKPRETIRDIIQHNPSYNIFILSAIYGFPALLSLAQYLLLGKVFTLLPILILSAILAPIWGYIFFSFISFIIYQVGKWIGGIGKYKEVRAVLAWSNLPMIVNVIAWLVIIGIFGILLFQGLGDKIQLSRWEIFLVLFLLLAQLIALIFSIVLFFRMLSEVQAFSIWKAILNTILALIFLLVVLIVLAIVVKGACSPYFKEPLVTSLNI